MRDKVINDIERFLSDNKKIFFNENEFQMYLAIFLKEAGYNIFVEYKIEVNDHKWYLDIVVEKGGRYVPIELKYKTTKRYGFPTGFKIFGSSEVKQLENQGAHNNGCYDFWYDVERIEATQKLYPENVELGIAVLLTNDYQYWTLTDDSSADYYNFRLKEGRHVTPNTKLAWVHNRVETSKSRKRAINISHGCAIHWQDTALIYEPKGKRVERFRYLILPKKGVK